MPLGNEGEWTRDVLAYLEDYFMLCFIGIGKPKADADVVAKYHNKIEIIGSNRDRRYRKK